MQNKFLIPPSKSLIRSFTLIELIVVIIIVGILAAVGMTQYGKTVEKMRGAELRATIGTMRQLATQYYLENGSCTGITASDIGIGAGQIPPSCTSTHYFSYGMDCNSPPTMKMWGIRCTSGGKSPSGPQSCYTQFHENQSTGAQIWYTNCTTIQYVSGATQY